MLSLGFSEYPDRRGINLAVRTCKTNKEPTVVCWLPPSLFMKEDDGPLFMKSG